jgi:hypothetical protein
MAGAGPRGEVRAHSTPHQLVEAVRRPRAVPAGRSDPPACSRDSVGPAHAPQTRPECARAFLWGICPRALLDPILACWMWRLFGLSAAFGGGHRPRVRRGATPVRWRGLGTAAPAPLERGGAICVRRWGL